MSKPWGNLIPEHEQRAYVQAGFGGQGGIGRRPALLVIDVQYRTTGTRPMPFEEATREFRTSCGETAWTAVAHIEQMIALFRKNDWPVIYPHVAPKKSYDGGRLAEKAPGIMQVPQQGYAFVAEVAPVPTDILVPKKHPSAFFGTSLVSHLVELGTDTLVMCGCTTSGCIRASVVDAFSFNYHVLVPEECVYDRSTVAHAVNLFDMAQKYANVMTRDEMTKALGKIAPAQRSA